MKAIETGGLHTNDDTFKRIGIIEVEYVMFDLESPFKSLGRDAIKEVAVLYKFQVG